MKYRKKPVAIEAIRYDGTNAAAIQSWAHRGLPPEASAIVIPNGYGITHAPLSIRTLEGMMTANPGDWIIRGVKGEFYPCKPDIFEATYEPVEESKP